MDCELLRNKNNTRNRKTRRFVDILMAGPRVGQHLPFILCGARARVTGEYYDQCKIRVSSLFHSNGAESMPLDSETKSNR